MNVSNNGEGLLFWPLPLRRGKEFFIYERINGNEWHFRAKKFATDAGSACDQWYASLRMRARQVVHFVGVTRMQPEHGRRKPVLAASMRDKLCYLFIGYGPGSLPFLFRRRRRHQRTSPTVSEWITL